ncbi:MAG TPA: twin-arginine translocase TatA/TatE family subunit [Rubrobacter sp.]|nr:twin-arginine translocase TatA/TatE family subunit [Rubrobacter sp.]
MFGLGVPELIFILMLALLIFGPKRLPEIGRTIGRGMSEFRKASNDLKRTINVELALDEPPPTPPSPMIRPSRQLDTLRAARFPDGSPVPLPLDPDDDRPAPIPPETPGEPT